MFPLQITTTHQYTSAASKRYKASPHPLLLYIINNLPSVSEMRNASIHGNKMHNRATYGFAPSAALRLVKNHWFSKRSTI